MSSCKSSSLCKSISGISHQSLFSITSVNRGCFTGLWGASVSLCWWGSFQLCWTQHYGCIKMQFCCRQISSKWCVIATCWDEADKKPFEEAIFQRSTGRGGALWLVRSASLSEWEELKDLWGWIKGLGILLRLCSLHLYACLFQFLSHPMSEAETSEQRSERAGCWLHCELKLLPPACLRITHTPP